MFLSQENIRLATIGAIPIEDIVWGDASISGISTIFIYNEDDTMAIAGMASQVTGVVEAKAVKGMNTSIMVNGEWYSSFKGAGLSGIEKGTAVDFLWKPDTKGMGFKNIIASTIKNLGGGTSGPVRAITGVGTGPSRKEYSTLGVELGHASNLAMELMIAKSNMGGGLVIGDDSFYKEWVHHLDKIFTIMQKIRQKKEQDSKPVLDPAPEPILASEETAVDDSIF